jgi:hypothetical protein
MMLRAELPVQRNNTRILFMPHFQSPAALEQLGLSGGVFAASLRERSRCS